MVFYLFCQVMAYFTKQTLAFFEHLAGNNSTDWFHANRSRYEESVKAPWDRFLKDMLEQASAYDHRITIAPKDAKFRINRDIRFSKNKEPYKTHVAAIISPYGRKDMTFPWLYIHIGHDGVHFACGMYQIPTALLYTLRKGMVHDLALFTKKVQDGRLQEYFWLLQGEKHIRLPKEFQQAAVKEPLLFNKQFYYYIKYASENMRREDLLAWAMEHWHAARSWNEYLADLISQ